MADNNMASGNMRDNGMSNGNAKQKRGFAAMDEDKQRRIASQGGKAAHASGNAHQFSTEEAREAGRKGGQNRGRNRKLNNNTA